MQIIKKGVILACRSMGEDLPIYFEGLSITPLIKKPEGLKLISYKRFHGRVFCQA
jgi:hypothetical protein